MDLDEVTRADIIAQMNKIEAMVEGRMNDDNIHQVSGKIASLGKSTFNDIADFGNPVYSDKFFAESPDLVDPDYYPDAVNVKEDIFDRIKKYAWYSDRFTVLSKKGTITLNYKNQENLEKPSVVITGDTEGISLESQRRIVRRAEQERERAYYEWASKPEEVASIGESLGTILLGGLVGAIAGAAGGPIGVAIGAIAGLAAGGVAVATRQAVTNYLRDDYDDSYDPYRENIQIMIFQHPPNYRMVSMLELTDLLSQYAGDEVRYYDAYPRQDLFSDNIRSYSAKISIENSVADSGKRFVTSVGQPMIIDAETTAVAFSVMPFIGNEDGEELIQSEEDFITALCEVDILFRILT